MRHRVSPDFLCRAALVVILATLAHQFSWGGLRFLTSEAVLRVLPWLHLGATRYSSDTLWLGGQLFQFVVACTMIDVFLGSIPLLWSRRESFSENIGRIAVAAVLLFAFNVARLAVTQWVYTKAGLSWVLVDGVIGACSYALIWLAILRQRSWDFLEIRPASAAATALAAEGDGRASPSAHRGVPVRATEHAGHHVQ